MPATVNNPIQRLNLQGYVHRNWTPGESREGKGEFGFRFQKLRWETVLANSFYSQYGLSNISGLPLHDDKGRYQPEKSMTDSQKDIS
ncbi:hypothetical protein TNCV_7871 [Trichonephila clavipes]|nr:hypothetical protein TNCV_7871 [Trichonephila clavipes]